jgi:hypothetical protein
MRSLSALVMSAPVAFALLTGIAAAGEGRWVVAMPPFRPEGDRIVVDTAAPLSAWVREGSFATEADCRAELRDESTRAGTALQLTTAFDDARLTSELQDQVIEAIRQARCVAQ